MGQILFEGKPLDTIDQREQSMKIGFVQQSPDNQIVTDKVWHELAFGLEVWDMTPHHPGTRGGDGQLFRHPDMVL